MQSLSPALRPLIPNTKISAGEKFLLFAGWLVLELAFCQYGDLPFVPTVTAIANSILELRNQGAFLEFGPSLLVMVEAILWTCAISLPLAYASTIPLFRPLAEFIAELRYLGLISFFLFFTLFTPDSHTLKVALLSFGMIVFYTRDMIHVVDAISQEQYDHARTLGMNPFRVVWEVVILGTLDQALESLRVNAAMGWMMLTAVEGIARSEGGIGVVLLNLNRHMDIAGAFAIMIVMLCIGAAQDWLIGFFKNYIICPWAKLGGTRA